MIMKLKSKLFELEADALLGSRPALKVTCKNPGCTHRCSVTFKTPKGFSSVSGVRLDSVFSLLCKELGKEKESAANVITQISLT